MRLSDEQHGKLILVSILVLAKAAEQAEGMARTTALEALLTGVMNAESHIAHMAADLIVEAG